MSDEKEVVDKKASKSDPVYVYSTLTMDQEYTLFKARDAEQVPVIERSVIIHGGANVANRKTVVTPKGVMTQIDGDQLKLLRNNHVFVQHEAGHYIIVVIGKRAELKEVLKDMKKKDGNAPLTPEDYVKGKGGLHVKTKD